MRRPVLLVALVLASASSSWAADPAIGRLAWLEGTWRGVSNGVAMEETWSSPEGGGLIGMHKDTKGGRLVSFEFFRIVPDSAGTLCYLTSPMGRPATPFCAIEVGERRVVFENATHDFPQRILYWMADGRLHARIEGTMDGKAASEEWTWTRHKGR